MDQLQESPIASSHHYYVIFIQSQAIKSLEKILSMFPHSKKEKIKAKPNTSYYHLQTEIARRYGSPSMLDTTKSIAENGQQFYLYDFYLGTLSNSEEKLYYICYPYLKLGKYIDKLFEEASLKKFLLKPTLPLLLSYMKLNKGAVLLDNSSLLAEIVKYGAEIKSDETIISISGKNPLKSKVYRELEESKTLHIEPVRLKLKCSRPEVGEIELSFDRLGNYRFWISTNNHSNVLGMIPDAFKVFEEANALVKESFINEYSMLENAE